MDYFLPTAVETPHWETDLTTTPSPHHPIGAKGVGESPNVGGVPCFSNAVNDAFAFLGSTHIQMPHDYWRNWTAAEEPGGVCVKGLLISSCAGLTRASTLYRDKSVDGRVKPGHDE